MPRHLISDAHEWINEIPTVPVPSSPNFLSPLSLPLGGRFFPALLQSRCPPLRLSEPLSGSHVDMATVAVSHPDPFPPPPCSSTSDQPPPNPSSTITDLPHSNPILGNPLPNLPVPSLSGHATASISAPAPHPRAADTPPPPDPFPPLPSTRPRPAASTARTSSIPLPPYPPPPLSDASLIHSPAPVAPPPGQTPVPIRSYAQASRGGKGSGFVRSHASDVSSFARLPRTGVSIVCGSKEGIPSFSFVGSDLPTVEDLYSNALVMKFHGGRPSLEASHREILSWGLEHPFTIGPLSSRAFLLRFQNTTDLTRVLTRPSTLLITFPYKIFRWHSLCHIQEDSCYAPVWISLPRLPLQCFIPEFLESVANRIGRFLCFDIATSTLARPSSARMCIELDLRKPPPPVIWVGLFEGLRQPIIYERLPKFCNTCQTQGHFAPVCPKGHRETLPIPTEPRSEPIRDRTQPVRQNATRQSSSITVHQDASATTFHNSTTPPPPNPATPVDITRNSAPNSAAEADGSSHLASKLTSPPLHVPSSQQSSNPLAVPPPPQSSSAGHQHISSISSVALLQAQQSAGPTAAVRSTSSTPSLPLSSRPSAVASPSGHEPLQPAASQVQRSAIPSTSITPLNPQPSSNHAPTLCPLCLVPGHNTGECPSGHREAIPKQAVSHPSSSHGCTPSVRQNAAKKSLPTSDHQHSSSPTTHNSPSIPPPPPTPYPEPRAATIHNSAPSSAENVGPPCSTPLVSLLTSSTVHNPSAPLHQISNMDANQLFWYAVNHQLALNEQARLMVPSVDARTIVPHSSPTSDDSSSRSSMAADSQPNSPPTTIQGARSHYDYFEKPAYGSEGEAPMTEPTSFIGHNTDDMIWQRPRQSKRNKRHPDQPLKVQLRARKSKTSNP